MEKLIFDSGVKEYQINDNGVLRFNPSDPNVYSRFMNAMEKITGTEKRMVEKAKVLQTSEDAGKNGAAVLALLAEADREIKEILAEVFGPENDFNAMLGGVNLLAVAGNGERVVTNFLAALQPIMVEGARKCAQQQANGAVAQAQMNRAQRRAAGKK